MGQGAWLILLLVVSSSDWFWFGQVKISGNVPSKVANSPASCPLVTAPCAQPHSHSFGFPCSGTSIRALPFMAACRFALSFLWRHVPSRSPFMAAPLVCTSPLMAAPCPLVCPLTAACRAMDQATCGHPHQGQAFAPGLHSHKPLNEQILLPNKALHLWVGGVGRVSMHPFNWHVNLKCYTNIRSIVEPGYSIPLFPHRKN